jgi:hypothetical protein
VTIFHASKYHKLQEYLVLGSQPLTALRDRIYCQSDIMFHGKNIPSGYFFIENTFYNDMRVRLPPNNTNGDHANNTPPLIPIDYSQ